MARHRLAAPALFVAAPAAVLSGLALLGPWLPPLDLLAQFAPIWLALAMVALVLGAVSRGRTGWRAAALGVVAAAAALVLVAPEFLRDRGPIARTADGGGIKVIQFNAWRGNRQVGRIADWVVSQHPDIVAIEEATPALRDAVVARTGWQVAGAAGDVMIFSRRPRIRMDRPASPPDTKLTWVNATYPSETGPYEVVATHLAWPLDQRRLGQPRALRQVVGALDTKRMILVGDFNATPWSWALKRLDHTLPLVRRDRALPTWPADVHGLQSPVPILPLDHIYAGPGWALRSLRRGPRLGSDHYPLVAVLAPTGKG